MPRCTYALAALLAVAPLVAPAQAQRVMPKQALRGEMVFGVPPAVKLNGKDATLAPGVRVRDLNNMIVLSGELVGQKLKVNYTVDTLGFIYGVWILRDDEIKQLWPKTELEAAQWSYDEQIGVWTKP
ncbi:hypothetical protein [Aquabacterium sp.]|uniref:hypothetical protein n=1 Tax=Aquabacterium sp. TaxID=1872578 RepID=UPI0035B33BE2